MEAKKKLLTYAGLKALEDELENLKVVKRKEVAGKIKEAREQGDLSENAEYDAAKDEQRDIEARIEELEKILKKIEKADEINSRKEEIYNRFCMNTREDWNEEKYQKLKREKALAEAAYFASLIELKAEVKCMLSK